MKDLTNVFIDLSKLSGEERTAIRRLLYQKREYIPYFTNLFEIDRYYKLHFDEGDWLCGDVMFNEKTELTYPEFIKLFEGEETDEKGQLMTYWSGKSTSKEVLQVENREFILCASLKFYDNIVSGHRHSDCYELIRKMCPNIADTSLPQREDQGFLTSLNRHVDRKEGWKIAKENNQIKWGLNASDDNEESQLISENLY